jgi:hypothetical protein
MTVQDVFLKIIRKVSPYSKDGVEITSANLSSQQPDRHTRARFVDIYQEARIALMDALMQQPNTQETLKEFIVVEDTFGAGPHATLPYPDNFVGTISVEDGGEVYEILPAPMEAVINSERLPAYTASTSRRFVVHRSEGIILLPSAADPVLVYVEIDDITEADVLSETPKDERFNVRFIPHILELAQAIANEYSLSDINALARSLVGAQQ